MSGDAGGIIFAPIALCIAAPIVIPAAAIAGTVLAVRGAIRLGAAAHDAHQRNKLQKLQELQDSGVMEQISDMYTSLASANREISAIYNKQSMTVSDAISNARSQWEKTLASDSMKHQIQFQELAAQMGKDLSELEKSKAAALCGKITELADAEDRELRAALDEANGKLQTEIRRMSEKIRMQAAEGAAYAREYYKNAEELYALLIKEYEGEKFCSHELQGISVLMEKCRAMEETAPGASYAVIWEAVEKTLLAINKAENLQQEWMMQYRMALQLAEEINCVFRYEGTLGYLVEGEYVQTEEEAQKLCEEKGIPFSGELALKADDYVYGELSDIKKDFLTIYNNLHKEDGRELSLDDLYVIVDDLTVSCGANVRSLMYEARMNLNEALLIDRIEEQINDALGGGYHSAGSARGGNCHNGEKHILFERNGDPEEQICVVLKNDGWGADGSGEPVFQTAVEVKSIKDKKISEKKRRAVRRRICDYMNTNMPGTQTMLACDTATAGRLSGDTGAANLDAVTRRTVERRRTAR